jgi:adenylate cyclase
MISVRWTSKTRRDATTIMVLGVMFGLIYPSLTDGFSTLGPLLNGLIIGSIGSSFIVYNELILSSRKMRKRKFRGLVLLKTLKYFTFFSLLIPLIVSITRSRDLGLNLREFIKQGHLSYFIFEDDYGTILIYTLFTTLIFIFTYQMSRKLGQGVLWKFLSGRYHHPVMEKRIFMFLDLNNSTRIAEQLGNVAYNSFLNEFFFDITDSIIGNMGNIYRYVGDEVVVTWDLDKHRKGEWLDAFFDARRCIEERAADYEAGYGIVPTFSAGFHCGEAVVGELGVVKSQISFFGNVLYEGTDIEKACRQFDVRNLISDRLLSVSDLPERYTVKSMGSIPAVEGGEMMLSTVQLVD